MFRKGEIYLTNQNKEVLLLNAQSDSSFAIVATVQDIPEGSTCYVETNEISDTSKYVVFNGEVVEKTVLVEKIGYYPKVLSKITECMKEHFANQPKKTWDGTQWVPES
jgi:thiol:disulfide interchange protein